ncbi:hypothetical protein [Streptomyces mirabilis]|uniref:hypothetical protein n=1 Tax=Streptomyces mirabilis TaxID=68239 RepID=UPI0036C9DBDF
MTSRHEQWTRLRRQLWQPPRAHGEQPRERVVGPLELFYDLVVYLAGDLDWHGLGLFAAVFALVPSPASHRTPWTRRPRARAVRGGGCR